MDNNIDVDEQIKNLEELIKQTQLQNIKIEEEIKIQKEILKQLEEEKNNN